MKKISLISGLLLFIILAINPAFAQVQSDNNNIWFHYFGKNMIGKKTSVSFEAVMRYANEFSEKQQWFVRPSVDYQFTKNFVGSLGYSHYNTYSYGDPAMNKINIPEDHVWIQGTYTIASGDFKFVNRLRDENRFVGVAVGQKDPVSGQTDYKIDHHDYRNRLRYMLLVNYNLTKKDGKTKLFTFVGDEVFMNIGSNAGSTFLNQNRIIGGFGYNINPHHQIQLSYIHQHIWNLKNTIQEENPTLRVSYITNFNL